jgi:hypothetical protein
MQQKLNGEKSSKEDSLVKRKIWEFRLTTTALAKNHKRYGGEIRKSGIYRLFLK